MDHEFDVPHDSPGGPSDAPAAADDVSLRVAVDACRPGSDDRRLPEVAEVLARHPAATIERLLSQSEKIDRAIMGAMRSLPAPERLAERLMSALAAQRADLAARRAEPAHELQCSMGDAVGADTSCPASPPTCATAETDGDRLAASRRTRSRSRLRPWAIARGPRTRRAWLATASLALVGLSAAYFAWPVHRRLAQEDVEQSAREFYQRDDHAAALSQVGTGGELPRTVVLAADHRGWRTVHDFLGRSGVDAVAHELVDRRGMRATLYVAPLDALGAVGLDSSSPSADTAGSLTSGTPAAFAWTEGDGHYLFVLVVDGNSRDLKSFIRSSDVA